MELVIRSVCADISECKCCGKKSPLFGVTDFHRSCRDGRSIILPLAGVPVYYYRCPQCGFIFTNFFDNFSYNDFAGAIYNNEYIAIDPDYKERRPQAHARMIVSVK